MSDTAIVIAAHNEQDHLERALRSCLAQTYPCEIVLVNDGSTDNTAQVAERFADRVTLITNTIRLGVVHALNRGIRAADARYIVRVDADDYVHRDFALALRLHLDLNPELAAVTCDYVTVDEQEQHLDRHSAEREPVGCGIMFRKDRLLTAGLYPDVHPGVAEQELAAQFTPQEVFHTRLPLYRYRRHPGSMSWKGQQ